MENLEIREIHPYEDIPYELLLDADPCRSIVDAYLPHSNIYLVTLADRVIGEYVLHTINDETIEIKNIAVVDEFQRRGFGTKMIADAEKKAASSGYREI